MVGVLRYLVIYSNHSTHSDENFQMISDMTPCKATQPHNMYIHLRRSRDGTLFVYLLPSFHSLWAAVTLSTYTHYIMIVYIERNNMPGELNDRVRNTLFMFTFARREGSRTRNFFPINAPGMGRFKLFDLVGTL